MTSKISTGIQQRVAAIIAEMNDVIMGRQEVIWGTWVARIAQQHVLLVGPGGTAKSYLARSMNSHIEGSRYFEVALDETTDPSQIFGPPDIKAMVEDGKTRRVPTNMLPEANTAFLDEFFNANGPLLHSIMPALNERIWHNNGQPSAIPLRQCLMGTNKLNADADQAALWDRVHLRYSVDYISNRAQKTNMIAQAITRMSASGRGVTTSAAATTTMVTLEELDTATKESLALDVPDDVMIAFLDLSDELKNQGITISNRREVEGMAAVLANAWLRGHETVRVADLDILTAMWWTLQDQQKIARSVILGVTNPGEKAALGLLDDLDKMRTEFHALKKSQPDPKRLRDMGIEQVTNLMQVVTEINTHLDTARASGASTVRLDEALARANAYKDEVSIAAFRLRPEQMISGK